MDISKVATTVNDPVLPAQFRADPRPAEAVAVEDSFQAGLSLESPAFDSETIREIASAPQQESPAPPEFLKLKEQLPAWKNVKIFLVHGSHTGGHRSAAESVKKALDELPNVDVEVVNTLDFSGGKAVKNTQVAATDFVFKRLAPVQNWFFRQSFEGNPLIYWLGNAAVKCKSWFSKSFLNKIKDEKPDIILSCHSPINSMLSHWKGKGMIDTPVHSVVTDYRVHRMWAQDNIDHYYVATESARKDLVNFGIDSNKIEASGIPVKPEFAGKSSLSKSQLKEKLGVDPQLPLVLMMGGSLGLGRFDEVAESLNSLKTPVQMVCITAKNQEMKGQLDGLQSQLQMPMKVLGYTKNVNEWMDACDAIITKPGGLTTSEVFAKKLPMIILDPRGPEVEVLPSIEATGAAFLAGSPEDAASIAEKLFNDPQMGKTVRANLEKVGKPQAAYTISKALVDRVLSE